MIDHRHFAQAAADWAENHFLRLTDRPGETSPGRSVAPHDVEQSGELAGT